MGTTLATVWEWREGGGGEGGGVAREGGKGGAHTAPGIQKSCMHMHRHGWADQGSS